MPRVLKLITLFILVFVMGITDCFSQSDSTAYKMKKVYFGIEVSPAVSFKGKFTGNEKYYTVVYAGEAAYTTYYNSKNNRPIVGCKIALKSNFKIWRGLRLNTSLQYAFLGYKTALVDTATVVWHSYSLLPDTKIKYVNSNKYKYLFHFVNLPILFGYEKQSTQKTFIHLYLGIEPTYLFRYVEETNSSTSNHLIKREEYEGFNPFYQVGDWTISEKFDDNYFLFYHARVGMNYFISKKRFLSFDAAYSVSSPRTGLKSQLHNVGLVIGYNF